MAVLEIAAAVRKMPRAGLHISGDSFDLVERPRGGVSLIVADGQGTGPAAKRMSGLVVARAASLIAEGVRDGAVARAVHDFLYALRAGRITCTLAVVSVDLNTGTVVVSRNSSMPVIVARGLGPARQLELLDAPVTPIGFHEQVKPLIRELIIEDGMTVVAFTDGVVNAGKRSGSPTQLEDFVKLAANHPGDNPDSLADRLFEYILDRCDGRPDDDITVVVLSIRENLGSTRVRSLNLRLPFQTSDIYRKP